MNLDVSRLDQTGRAPKSYEADDDKRHGPQGKNHRQFLRYAPGFGHSAFSLDGLGSAPSETNRRASSNSAAPSRTTTPLRRVPRMNVCSDRSPLRGAIKSVDTSRISATSSTAMPNSTRLRPSTIVR